MVFLESMYAGWERAKFFERYFAKIDAAPEYVTSERGPLMKATEMNARVSVHVREGANEGIIGELSVNGEVAVRVKWCGRTEAEAWVAMGRLAMAMRQRARTLWWWEQKEKAALAAKKETA